MPTCWHHPKCDYETKPSGNYGGFPCNCGFNQLEADAAKWREMAAKFRVRHADAVNALANHSLSDHVYPCESHHEELVSIEADARRWRVMKKELAANRGTLWLDLGLVVNPDVAVDALAEAQEGK